MSFAIDWWLGGGEAWIFHLNNFILHILSALILFKVCLKLWPQKLTLGFLISLTFLLHPLKAESVAWITERKDVLSGLFLWLTIYFYLTYLDNKKLRHYLFSNLSFLLALAGKVSVVFLPIFLLVIDWYKNRELGVRSLVAKMPFALVSLVFGLLNVFGQSSIVSGLTFPEKNYLYPLYQIQFYLEKFIFPLNLRAWYSPEFLHFNSIGIFSVALILLFTIFIFKKSPDNRKDVVLGLLLFALFLLPNLTRFPFYCDPDIVHDRYMYIALTGLTFAFFPFILQSIEILWRDGRRFVSFAVSGVIAAVIFQWLILSYLQIPYWKNPITLWQRSAELEPQSGFVVSYLGDALLRAGRYEESVPYLQKSYGRAEDFERLGYVLDKIKKQHEAQNIILEGLKLYPSNSALLNMLGTIKLGLKENNEALNLFTQALDNLKNEFSPRLRATILNNLGLVNAQLGNYNGAEYFFRQSLSLINNDETIIYGLGLVLFNQNRLEEARGAFLHSLKLNPNRAGAYNGVGAIFYSEKNFAQARLWLTRALEIDPGFEPAQNNLIALDKKGR